MRGEEEERVAQDGGGRIRAQKLPPTEVSANGTVQPLARASGSRCDGGAGIWIDETDDNIKDSILFILER
jgi:hypothetical protein